MNDSSELHELMQNIAKKCLSLTQQIQQQPNFIWQSMEKYFEFNRDFQSLLTVLLKNPEPILEMVQAYFKDALSLLQDTMETWLEGREKPPIQDKRFAGEEWINYPFFHLLSQQYILASEHMNALLERLEYEDKFTARRVRFFARQYLDALSPDNFFHTNPQLIAETMQTHGKNLLLGLKNFLSDIDVGGARLIIKMTDMDAFEVGKNIATTPGDVIFRNDLMELIQYKPQTPKVYAIPLLIIPPWINKYYILDLSPENSFIRWIVEQGISVFAISWVNPDKRYAEKSLYHYLQEGPLTAIEVIKKQLAVEEVNALGFCIGGTLLAMLLAYQKAKKQPSVHSATFLASLIDFTDPGDIGVFIDEQQISKLEERMSHTGYLEGHFMASAFNSLRASDLIWSFFIKHYLRGMSPVPFDLLYWNADTTNMPAAMHSQYLRWMYLHNYLIQPGKISLNHTRLDVTQIETPSFFVSTMKDHIAPWQSVYRGFQLSKGKKRFVLGGSGHIAGIVNPPDKEKYGFYASLEAPEDPNQWLALAEHHPGSWWPEWLQWLIEESGSLRAVKKSKWPYPSLMSAPGEYVLGKSV